MVTINHLGPYDVSDIDDDILGDVVYNKRLPVIVKQMVGNEEVFSVLAKDKGLKIICAGCFNRDMRITNVTRCKKCSSFVKHWDTKDRLRCIQCKETTIRDVAANCQPVTMNFDAGAHALADVSDAELVAKVEKRDLMKCMVERITDGNLMDVMRARGIWPIFDARPTKLIHELRRQAKGVEIQAYYHDEKKVDFPHSSDEVGVDILEKTGKDTRRSKMKMVVTHYLPRSVTDYR
jgi:hypothetical protein